MSIPQNIFFASATGANRMLSTCELQTTNAAEIEKRGMFMPARVTEACTLNQTQVAQYPKMLRHRSRCQSAQKLLQRNAVDGDLCGSASIAFLRDSDYLAGAGSCATSSAAGSRCQ